MPRKGKLEKSGVWPLAGAVLFLLLGVGMLVWPDAILTVFPPLVGAVLVVVGIQAVAYNLVMGRRVANGAFALLRGVINILVGAIFLVKRDLSLAFLSILFGLYVLVGAAMNLSTAAQRIREKKPFATELWDGVFNLVLGLLLLFSPFTGRSLWVRVLGVHFIVSAGTSLVWMLRRGGEKPVDDEGQDGGPPPETDG
ncbi:MAG: DUF308 domain-containing protein [Oscillospiraceae bacterium]